MASNPTPTLFIASSTEQLDSAYAVQHELDDVSNPVVWKQGTVKASQSVLVSLGQQLEACDFGVFIFAPDDTTTMRANESNTVRDNVIFELGMFIGRLGPERCYVVIPHGAKGLHLPSDLHGFTPLEYRSDRPEAELRAAFGPACNEIRKAVRKPRSTERTAATLASSNCICQCVGC